MANINLISAYRAERVRLTRWARALLVVEAICVLCLGGAFLFLGGRIFLARHAVGNAERELAKLSPSLNRIEDVERQRTLLSPKLTTLTEAQINTRRWVGIMESLKRCIPPDTWLTSVAVETNPEKGLRLKLNGVTGSQTAVGETMLRLSKVRDYYQRVDLNYTRPLVINRSTRVEFELLAPLAVVAGTGKAADES